MHAWFDTTESDKLKLCRRDQMRRDGLPIKTPPVTRAGFLIQCLSEVGMCAPGLSGPVAITATELTAWRDGTATPLGPIDFQDLLSASRAYVAAVGEYGGKVCDPPWVPELTDEEKAAEAKAQEALLDKKMGLK